MAISQKSIQDRALRIATMVGADPNGSPVIDNGVVIEDMFAMALREAIIAAAQSDTTVSQVKRSHSIVVTDGVGVLPDTVIDECLDTSSLESATDDDITQLSSYQPRYADYVRPVHSQLPYYTVRTGSFLFRNGDRSVYDGTVTLVAVAMPPVVAFTADLDISTDIAESTVQILAQRLRGVANG